MDNTDWAERIYDKHDENDNTVPFSISDIEDVIVEVKEACLEKLGELGPDRWGMIRFYAARQAIFEAELK